MSLVFSVFFSLSQFMWMKSLCLFLKLIVYREKYINKLQTNEILPLINIRLAQRNQVLKSNIEMKFEQNSLICNRFILKNKLLLNLSFFKYRILHTMAIYRYTSKVIIKKCYFPTTSNDIKNSHRHTIYGGLPY